MLNLVVRFKVHDSHSAYIDALLGRISPPVVNSHVPMETSPDVPSDSDRSFFQVNRAVYCSYDKPPGELFYKSSARIAVSQGKIIDSVELGLLLNDTRSNIDEMLRAFRFIDTKEEEIDGGS